MQRLLLFVEAQLSEKFERKETQNEASIMETVLWFVFLWKGNKFTARLPFDEVFFLLSSKNLLQEDTFGSNKA